MRAHRARIIAPWLIGVAAAAWIVAHAHYVTDLSAFLPAKPTALQQLLVEQLRDGPASRVILIGLEAGTPSARAQVSRAMAQRLGGDAIFASVANGDPRSAERDRALLFDHRYLLSDAVTAEHFSSTGLRQAIEDTIGNLASPTGLVLKSLVPRDPTGEMLHLIDQFGVAGGPKTQDGVWTSADGTRALLIVQTAAAGSDTDAQERAVEAVRAAFGASAAALPAASTVRLRVSGPGVFAVAARDKIKRAATRLSLVSGSLVIAVLLAVYRSTAALALGLLPVATGALFGVAAVALGFGVVHGVTLGFGITLIGECVDYSIYFFIQSQRRAHPAADAWHRSLWPTIRLGMLTSVCGFASLLPSGFPGLAQLGLYSISGLIAAALVTRFVLPELLPPHLRMRDVTPLGLWIARRRAAVRRRAGPATAIAAWLLAAAALGVLGAHHASLWNRELSALSPVAAEDLRYDATLRADLGTGNVLDLVIVGGDSLEAVLQGAERATATLRGLVDARVIGAFDSPASYLPSTALQQRRRSALPDEPMLRSNLHDALADLDLKEAELEPFIADVAAARSGPLLGQHDLRGTSLAAGFNALILRHHDRWSALLPLHAVDGSADIDVARVGAALAAAHLADTQVLDLKAQADALYASYLKEAIRLSLCGFALIVLLLSATLRSARRTARVLAPLVLAVLCVAVVLNLCGERLTILHLVGMLLIVAVGSNYALFFDDEAARRRTASAALTLASLAIANLSTVIGFGLLAFSQVPVLEALGETVAPGAFLALIFSALLTSTASPEGADA